MARRGCPPPALLLLLLLATGLAGAQPGGLYSPAEPLVLLQVDTLEHRVLDSSSAWLVEFYASWCGHCVHFAPTWRALAADVQDWRPAVNLGVLDCAEMANQKACEKFRITGFPTLKFFKAFSKSPADGMKIFHPGNSVESLRQSIITHLETHKETWPPACPPLEPASMEEIRGFFQANNITYLALIFETNDSFVGREVTLDMLLYENIAVRRVLSSEEDLVKKYRVTTFPSGILFINNGTFHRIPVKMEVRSFYTHFLRQLPGVTRSSSTPTVAPDPQIKTTPMPWRPADRSKLYMADLESALHYALRVEVARFSVLTGERLKALKNFVAVLAKYFPGRPFVQNFLRSADRWLRHVRGPRIPYRALELVLTNRKEGQAPAVLSNNVTWVGCQGSKPHFRGYPCSLWTLFHLLTVQATKHRRLSSGPLEVLGAMRGYVQCFFGCRECAQHFEGMAAESINQVSTVDEAALWLWSRHNRVNARLAGTETEDPKFPKLQWPPLDLCPPCHDMVNGHHVWDEAAVLHFLKAHFSPANIFLDYTVPEMAWQVRRSREAKERAGERGRSEGIEGGENEREEEEDRGEDGREEEEEEGKGRGEEEEEEGGKDRGEDEREEVEEKRGKERGEDGREGEEEGKGRGEEEERGKERGEDGREREEEGKGRGEEEERGKERGEDGREGEEEGKGREEEEERGKERGEDGREEEVGGENGREGDGGEDGREGEEKEEGEERRTEKPAGARVEIEAGGLERRGSSEPRRPSIVRMNAKAPALEEDIVDLDSFSELHYKSKALKAAAMAASKGRRLSKRDTMPLLMGDDSHQAFDYAAAWERLRRRGLGSKQLIGALEEEGEGKDALRRNHWFHMLGAGFSRLDVSLCIILYFLSSMCLLGMYAFFRLHTRHHKGRPGFPTA